MKRRGGEGVESSFGPCCGCRVPRWKVGSQSPDHRGKVVRRGKDLHGSKPPGGVGCGREGRSVELAHVSIDGVENGGEESMGSMSQRPPLFFLDMEGGGSEREFGGWR